MNKVIISLAILASLSLFAKAQSNFVRQPDSAKIYFDTTANPQWYYGGVWDFRCSYDSDGVLRHTIQNRERVLGQSDQMPDKICFCRAQVVDFFGQYLLSV